MSAPNPAPARPAVTLTPDDAIALETLDRAYRRRRVSPAAWRGAVNLACRYDAPILAVRIALGTPFTVAGLRAEGDRS